MAKFTDDFVAGLKPRAQKYDEFESEEFGVRVFPNGTRTWLFTYEVNGFRRFKTVGIFPDMKLEEARKALEMNKRIAEIDDGVTIREADTIRFKKPDFEKAPSIADGDPKSQKSLLPWIAVTLAAAAGLAGVAYVYLPGFTGDGPNLEPPALTETTKAARKAEAPPVSIASDTTREAPDEPKSSEENTSEEPASRPDREPKFHYDTSDDPLPGQKRARVKLAEEELIPEPYAEASSTEPASVPRAQFTSEIIELEPVDRIGPTILADDEGVTVIFFTDIQNAKGQEITHVWEHDGREVARVPFDVNANWRWRVHSKKRVKASQAGMWRVTVYDQSGIPIKADGFIVEAEVPVPDVLAEVPEPADSIN